MRSTPLRCDLARAVGCQLLLLLLAGLGATVVRRLHACVTLCRAFLVPVPSLCAPGGPLTLCARPVDPVLSNVARGGMYRAPACTARLLFGDWCACAWAVLALLACADRLHSMAAPSLLAGAWAIISTSSLALGTPALSAGGSGSAAAACSWMRGGLLACGCHVRVLFTLTWGPLSHLYS